MTYSLLLQLLGLLGGLFAVAPPLVIPVWGYGGFRQGADPGAVADRHLFAVILDNTENTSAGIAENCPGISSTSTCQPYKYVDFLHQRCSTRIGVQAYRDADSHIETAFLHTYAGPRTLENRLTWGARNPSGGRCGPHNTDAFLRIDPGDAAFNRYLYENYWAGSNYRDDFPPPYGAFEDNAEILAGVVVGGFGAVSTEYGSGTRPSGFADRVGNSPYHDPTDWETALGIFVNGACAQRCVDMALNGIATGWGYVGACRVIADGRCHAQFQAGDINDQAAIDNVCKAVTGGNLKWLMAERPIFGGRGGYGFMDSETMTVEINTAANLNSYTSGGCAKTKIVDLETSYGEGGPGDVSGGHRVRLAALAFRWLVPDPMTGIPDRVVSFQIAEGRTMTEAPYFFEDTLVPAGAEHPVVPFVWNGAVATSGGGCPAGSGDRGGAVGLLVECVGAAGIYCQQYEHLYINGADYGKTAACLNTSTSSREVVGSWFKRDPISSYRYRLSLQGGEMRSVPYRGVRGGSIALNTCTNAAYCTGSDSLSAQAAPFRADGNERLCGPCGAVFLQEKSPL